MFEKGFEKLGALHLAEHRENSNPAMLIALPTDFLTQIMMVLTRKSFGNDLFGSFKAK